VPSDLSSWVDSPQSKSRSSSKASLKKKQRSSLLTQLLIQIQDRPIRPSGYPQTPSSSPPGVLINIDYQGDARVAKIKLYDVEKREIYEWNDITQHHPYCLTDLTREELAHREKVIDHPGFLKLEEISKFNLLLDKEQQYTVIVAKDPLAIGGRPDSIREKLGRDHSWEADIRYTQCYTMDRALTPGLLYRIQKGALVPVPQEFSAEDATKIRGLFKGEAEQMKLIEKYLPLFLTQAPNFPRLALDIEVESEFIDRIPDPEEAPQPVISIALVDDTGTGRVFILRRDRKKIGTPNLPNTVQIELFDDESKLLETVFRILWRTPLLLTFNGDNFDLRYLANRAKKLGIPSSDNPIRMRGGFRGNPEAELETGVHIDLYRFFHNRSIQIYAFRNRYREVRLENLSQALLGEGKIELTESIHKIPTSLLAEYNWQDAHLTMQLTQFDNNLVMNLILLLMRLSHQGMHDLTRTAVSNWIRSLLYYAHRQRNFLIPRQDEIAALKGEAVTEAIIKGKKYMGAIVVEPKAGVHFGVTVLDFASLYPSIMKAYNLSYETVRCDHPECKTNIVPGTPHWVCTRREGLTSQIIGLIRDVRVEHFKPRATDTTLSPSQRSWYSVVEQALKVFLNACLPFDEEVIIKTPQGQIEKRNIVALKDIWAECEILSINSDLNNGHFGTPIFVPIKGFAETGTAKILKITLNDGRLLRCTHNHIVPIYTTQPKRRYGKEFQILEIPAGELKAGDELLLCSQMPLSESPPSRIFIPDLIDSTYLLIGMHRNIYKRFSYRRNQSTNNKLIQIIDKKFSYSKNEKLYKAYWTDLSEEVKDIIREAPSDLFEVKISKSSRDPSFWQAISIPLSREFFQLLGWYIAEGHGQQNRLTITQSIEKNSQNIHEILKLLRQLNWPAVFYNDKTITVHSNVLSSVVSALCGTHANNKSIPIFLLNKERTKALLDTYFKGDGNYNFLGQRRYSTASLQLSKDLIFLISALGKYSSLHRDSDIVRVVETSGKNYARKYLGIMNFNGTNLVRVKSIEIEPHPQPIFDIETGNGWFVTTNGIVTHNSYGVLGASHFPLYCAPAAESITALGRFAITETIKKAEEIGVTVLYGDTDSLFLKNPGEDQLRQLIEYSERELRVELDVEKEYRYVALSSRKKNYLGVSKDGQVDIKGLTGKKRNTPAFLQEAFMQMIDILRQVRDSEGFSLAKEQILTLAREKLTILERREFEVDDLAIRVQVTKNLDAYVKTTPQHVKAARQLQDAGREVKAGDIIAFVKTTGGVKPVEHASVQDIDIAKYKDLVKSTFEQVLDALGIEWLDTIGMRRLDTFFG
jgi:DNA polymerase elongation subunit (family B)